jgi:hypothetical protein
MTPDAKLLSIEIGRIAAALQTTNKLRADQLLHISREVAQLATSTYVPRETVIEECAKYIESHANACLPGSAADDQNWPFALQSCANEMRRDLLKDRSGCEGDKS